MAEDACFGYPLGSRTPIVDARVLEPAEIVEVTDAGTRTFTYWNWDDVPVRNARPEEICDALTEAFKSSVRLRLGASRRAVSMLSGGLDSRCVVACLREAGAEVDTINFGPDGSADLILGRQIAAQLGTRHYEAARGALDFWDRLVDAHASWRARDGSDYPDDQTPSPVERGGRRPRARARQPLGRSRRRDAQAQSRRSNRRVHAQQARRPAAGGYSGETPASASGSCREPGSAGSWRGAPIPIPRAASICTCC